MLRVLRASQQQLVATLATLDGDGYERASYDDEWTIAQVASHLGSGAEGFRLFLDAGLNATPAPGVEQFQPIWDRWNAKTPAQQVADVVQADAAFLDAVEALPDEQQRTWRLDVFGAERDLAGLLRMRLAEHALHTWDIAVVLDPHATVPADAAGLLVEQLAMLVQYAAKPQRQLTVNVTTVDPGLDIVLALAPEGSTLTVATTEEADASVELPAEALVRLVYGRLDPDHTPTAVIADPSTLETLRTSFPGV
jgi:uncharacterized protein (TIGR03083 family)